MTPAIRWPDILVGLVLGTLVYWAIYLLPAREPPAPPACECRCTCESGPCGDGDPDHWE